MLKNCEVSSCPGSKNCPLEKALAKATELKKNDARQIRKCAIGNQILGTQSIRKSERVLREFKGKNFRQH